jgi:AraC-type DNA-binding domain-containing proteins
MLPIHFLDKNGHILFEASERYVYSPISPCKDEVFRSLFESNDIYDFPIFRTNKYYETFFYISVKNSDNFIGTFIVGPSLDTNVSLEAVDELISDFNLPINYKKNIFNYYNQLPIISHSNLMNFSLVLYYSIYNKKLDIATIKEQNYTFEPSTLQMYDSLSLTLSETRKNTSFHTPYKHERILLECIKAGNLNKLLQLFYSPISGEAGTLSKRSPIRNQKNNFIVACTLSTRAAMEGGINHEIAYSLSDEYIQHVEDLKTIEEVSVLLNKMFLDFTNRVNIVKSEQRCSKYITMCKNYIFNHLYEEITLPQLSEIVKLNPSYLSELFTKEVGISMSNYIQRERVNEAKKLLSLSDYSLSEICTLLNFGAQSYFSTVFKKVTGVTPKEYRALNKIT